MMILDVRDDDDTVIVDVLSFSRRFDAMSPPHQKRFYC